MTSVFDPIDIAKLQVENLADLTPAQKAGKLIASNIKMGGEDYMMWSKYDHKGVLMQRAILRTDLIENDSHNDPLSHVKVRRDPADPALKDLLTDRDLKDFL